MRYCRSDAEIRSFYKQYLQGDAFGIWGVFGGELERFEPG